MVHRIDGSAPKPGVERATASSLGTARRFAILAAAIARGVGPRAALRAVPLFVAVGLASAIVFGGNGMRAADLAHVAKGSIPVRVALCAIWVVAVLPVAHVILTHTSTHYLRALPLPRAYFVAIHAALLCLANLPFAALYAAGEGLPSSLAAMATAAGAASLAVARLRRNSERIAAGILLVAIVAGVPSALLLPAGVIALAIGAGGAWDRAPIESTPAPRRGAGARLRSTIVGPPAVALAIAHVHALLRTEGAAVRRSLVVVIAGGAVLPLAASNNDVRGAAGLTELALVIGALPLGVACGALASPVLDAERRLRWILDVTATGASTRARAATGATALAGLAAGLIFGSSAAVLSNGAAIGARAALVGAGAGAGGALGVVAAAWARRADRPLGVDGSALVASMVGTILATIILGALLGPWALLPMAAAAMALVPGSLQSRKRTRLADR